MQQSHGWQALLGSELVVLAILIGAEPATQAQKPVPASITVKLVDYDMMAKIVNGFPAKVVVVDFWSTT